MKYKKSNMSKLGVDGKPIFNDKGKVMKGPNYFKPNFFKADWKITIFFFKKAIFEDNGFLRSPS